MPNQAPPPPAARRPIHAPEPPPRPTLLWEGVREMPLVLMTDPGTTEQIHAHRITERCIVAAGGEEIAADPGDFAYQWPNDPSRVTVLPKDVAEGIYEIVDAPLETAAAPQAELEEVPALNAAGTPLGFKVKKAAAPVGSVYVRGKEQFNVIAMAFDRVTMELVEPKAPAKKGGRKKIARRELAPEDALAYMTFHFDLVELVLDGKAAHRAYRVREPIKLSIDGALLDADPGMIVTLGGERDDEILDVEPAEEIVNQGYEIRDVPKPSQPPADTPPATLGVGAATEPPPAAPAPAELESPLVEPREPYPAPLEPTNVIGVHGAGVAKILEIVVNVVKRQKKAWKDLSEHEQRMVIQDLDDAVSHVARDMITEAAAHSFPNITAALEQVAVKDGLKATLSIPSTHPRKHELIDRVKQSVVVVLVDASLWTEGPRPKAEKDQPDLPGVQ